MELPKRLLPLLAVLAIVGASGTAHAAAPTLTNVGVITGIGNSGQDWTITYEALAAAANEADADGDTIQFRYKGTLNGTLKKNGSVVPLNGTLSAGESWIWTSPVGPNGNVNAFTVRAFANGEESASDVAVQVNVSAVNLQPSFTGTNVVVAEDSGPQTITNWVSSFSTGSPAEFSQTVQYSIASVSNPSLFSTPPSISPAGTMTFTPAPNENGSSIILVQIIDNGGTANGGDDRSNLQPYTITVNPLPDAPTITATFKGTTANPFTDAGPVGSGGEVGPVPAQSIFQTVDVDDVDFNKPNFETVVVTVTVPTVAESYGSFSFPGASVSNISGGKTYTLPSLSPGGATSALGNSTFTPFANANPVALYTFGLTVAVRDSTSLQATPLTPTLNFKSVSDLPTANASLAVSFITDAGPVSPFRLAVADVDQGDTFSVTISESGTQRGSLSASTFTGTASQIASAIQALVYTPFKLAADQTATFDVDVTDVHPDGSTGTVGPPATPVRRSLSLPIHFINDAPELSGVSAALIRTTDDPAAPTVYPFSTITVLDPDPGQVVTVTLSLGDTAQGGFSGPTGTFTSANVISGTVSEVTTKLRQVAFVPTSGRIPVNQSETVTITIRVNDGTSTVTNNQTQVEVTAVDGAPSIRWKGSPVFPLTSSPALIDPSTGPKPFADVSISDRGQVEVIVAIDNTAKGTLSNLGGFVETASGSGRYRFTGTADAAQTAIREIIFTIDSAYLFPPGQPGRTDFTISAADTASNFTSRVLPIVLVSDSRTFLVTKLLDDETIPGTLRHAIASASNNDIITFALPTYPATIRLSKAKGPLILNKHLSFRGPGADKLTISGDSNANAITDPNDVEIFRVFASVQIRGLTFARGFSDTGGAIYVGRAVPDALPGSLVVEDCIFSDCVATQWGGALDVDEASVSVSRCSFERNSLNASSGLGGGAVSLYTNLSCSFVNSTFSGNSQGAPTGFGGGAIYIENDTPTHFVQTTVTHCTFAGNNDSASNGSSIHNNVSNSRVLLTNNIFADFSGRNLVVVGGAEMLSAGGNISNDNTSTTFIQGGVPQLAVLLNQTTDKRNLNPKLGTYGQVEGQTRAYRLLPDSPAIGTAVAGAATTDQRGVIRNSTADMGALDANALGKLVIHEIQPTTNPNNQFIEFYNPRDQAGLNIAGYEVWIDGVKRHTFASPQVIPPGHGIIVAGSLISALSTPVVVSDSTLSLTIRSRVELRKPLASGGALVEGLSYSAAFANATTPSVTEDYTGDSITLAPQYQGVAFVPHRLVQPPPNGGVLLGALGSSSSPGADSAGTPFGEPNAYPIATNDSFEVNEDVAASLNVRGNDLDADGSDELFLVDVNPTISVIPPSSNNSAILSPAGASVTITPAASPLRGTAVTFDPRVAFNSLPEGARVTDTFAYSIVDVGGGAVSSYADGGSSTTLVTAPAHRLVTGDTVTIRDAGPVGYNATHAITVVDADRFSIPIAFAGNPDPLLRGRWQASVIRTPSARDEALVQVTVLGRNDPPTPAADSVATNEDTILRVFADPRVSDVALDTDVLYSQPRSFNGTGLLTNDTDPDTDGNPYTQLKVVGVCQANAITSYSGTVGSSPVTVTSPAHGLETGATVLISGYGGHPSYNGYQIVTVTGPDTFTLPIEFVDNSATKGLWAVLGNTNRLSTVSKHGAAVTLEIRSNRTQTNLIYNPRPSAYLDGLANGESATDTFYYAVEDNHGAVSLAQISVQVAGVNNSPIPRDNPSGLTVLGPLLVGGTTPAQVLDGSSVLHLVPSATSPGRFDVSIRHPGGAFGDMLVVNGLDQTDEDSVLNLTSSTLLADDTDIDRTDVLRLEIGSGQSFSREGARITLSPNGATLSYDPTTAPNLQALAFKERVIDTFTVTVFDGIARVNTLVAVLVEGRNDRPDASNVTVTTNEKSLLEIKAPGLLVNGSDLDQNTTLPDNRKFLRPVSQFPTTIFGSVVNVLLAKHEGGIDGFAAVSGNPGVTAVTATAHGLNTGEEVVLLSSGALTGQFVLTRVDENTFTIPVAFQASYSSLGGGTWRTLASTFQYDPSASVFSDLPGGPSLTLQGLAEGETYDDTFTYTMLDGSFLFANDDIYRVEADRTDVELLVLGNDTSLDGVATSRHIVEVGPLSAGGSVEVNEGVSLIYTPETGFVGDEVFSYTIEDDLGNRDTAMVTVRVTIDRLNGNLRANDDRFTVAAGQTPLVDVLANDSIIPATGDPLTLQSIVSAPSQGGQAVIESGKIRYTPNPAIISFPYTETFEYRMSGGGTASATATVNIVVVNRNNTLNVRADSFSVPVGSVSNTLNVLENDNILPGNGEDLEIVSVTAAAHGTVESLNGVALTYTPTPGFLGTDSLSYTVVDGFGGTGTALVTVKVGFLTINSDFFGVQFDNPTKTTDDGVTTLDVLANDNVLQGGGGQLTITGVSPSSSPIGTISVTSGGTSLSFDPAVGATGQQNFIYTVSDVGGRTATGTVTVVVVSGGIRASSDFFTVPTGSQSSELSVLSNDVRISEIPGQLSVSAIGTGLNAPDKGGSVEISADYKKLVYTPASGFTGTESFTYTVTDGDSTDTARVSVRTTNGEMVAADDDFLIFRGSTENRLPVLLNDRVIPDAGQQLLITAVGNDPGNVSNPPNRGTLEIIEDGAALRYTPSELNAPGSFTETFTYEISAGGTARTEALIRIQVLNRVGARDLETNHDHFSVRSDSTGTLLPVLANDSVLPASAGDWVITEVSAPSSGAVQIIGTDLFYAPQPGFVGTDVFTYKVSDGFGGTGQADVTVKVGDISVSNDAYTVVAGAGVVSLNVTANDGVLRTSYPDVSLPSQADFTLTTSRPVTVDPVAAGTAVVASGAVNYTPASGFTGKATLTYWVRDDSGNEYPGIAVIDQRAQGNDRRSAVATIHVTGVNDAPKLLGAEAGVVNDKSTNHPFPNATVVEYDSQRQQPVTIRVSFPADRGLLSGGGFVLISPGLLEFTGTAANATTAMRALVFTPFTNRITVGTTENTGFTVSMNDGFTPTPVLDSGAVVTVTPVNDPPVITGAVSGQLLYQRSTLSPFVGVNIVDVDDLGLQSQVVTVSIDNAIKGYLTNLGGFSAVPGTPGAYRIQGTPAAVSNALRGLVFQPTPGSRITPTNPELAVFTVKIEDSFAAPVINSLTSVQILHGQVDRLLALDSTGADASQAAAAFGTSTAISGDTMVIGAPLRNTPPVDAGRVNIFERNAGFGAPWGQVMELGGTDTVAGDQFGQAVAIDGDFMVVGAPGADIPTAPNAGAAYVFRRDAGNRNSWTQFAKLVPPAFNTGGGDAFGSAVAIQGNTLFVGAPLANLTGAARSGRAFVFKLGGGSPGSWTLSQTLVALDNRATNGLNDFEYYGASIAMDGDTAIIGAHGANRAFSAAQWNFGAAYLYTRPNNGGSWNELKRLDEFADVGDAKAYTGFGYSVDISGDVVAVGIHSIGAPFSAFKPGGAKIYERNSGGANQWGLTRTIAPYDGVASGNFGSSVAVAGKLVMIGSPGPSQNSALTRGFVELYRLNSATTTTWDPIDLFIPGNNTDTDRFGSSVALDGFTGAAGAPGDSVNATNAAGAGSARVYQFQYDLGPRLAVPIPDQGATVGSPFAFTVPASTFGDPVYPGQLTLSVQLSNGNPLPVGGWLSFNPATRTFSGTPTSAETLNYNLRVTATNPLGSKVVSNVFRITNSQNALIPELLAAYQTWTNDHFQPSTLADPDLEATVWGMGADSDGDTYSNLIEMLFGTDPVTSDNPDLVFTRISSTQVSLEFPRTNQIPQGKVQVEWSNDLVNWSRSNVVQTDLEALPTSVKVKAVATTLDPQTRMFVRVVVDP